MQKKNKELLTALYAVAKEAFKLAGYEFYIKCLEKYKLTLDDRTDAQTFPHSAKLSEIITMPVICRYEGESDEDFRTRITKPYNELNAAHFTCFEDWRDVVYMLMDKKIPHHWDRRTRRISFPITQN